MTLGEDIVARVHIVNNRDRRHPIWVYIPESTEFMISTDHGKNYRFCHKKWLLLLDPSETRDIYIWVRPVWVSKELVVKIEFNMVIGDVSFEVSKTLEVIAPGQVVRRNRPTFVQDVSAATPIAKTIPFASETKLVPGSLRFDTLVTGSIYGATVEDLDVEKLFDVPFNNIFSVFAILRSHFHYFGAHSEYSTLSIDKFDEALQLISADIRRLSIHYRRSDFGFSPFGEDNSASSTELTTNVVFFLNTIHNRLSIASHIFPTDLLHQSWTFVLSQSRHDGLFDEAYPARMRPHYGGLHDKVSLTAWIYFVMAEQKKFGWTTLPEWPTYDVTTEVLRGFLFHEKNNDPYQLILILYGLDISGKLSSSEFDLGWAKLLDLAEIEADEMYWPIEDGLYDFGDDILLGTTIETTALTLALLVQKPPTTTRLEEMRKIYNFLNSNRNARGTFASVTDTTAGLLGIYGYQRLLKALNPPCSQNIDIDVTISYHDGTTENHQFDNIDDSNSLIPQRYRAHRDTLLFATFNFDPTSKGEALVQLSTEYNVMKVKSLHFRGLQVISSQDGDYTVLQTCVG